MKISEVVLERFNRNQKIDAYVKGVASKVSDHVCSNSMVFFPEYTDHNITHIEAVIETAIDLATEESLEIMTDVDFAILATSVMLHDLGMHLSKDGFETLIANDGPLRPIGGFSDRPWRELWMDFLSEARRFDAKTLESLFGHAFRPVNAFPSFDEPWSEFDFLLVGEFLRRHHPRLAHEIALQGMPSKDGGVIRLCEVGSETEKFLSDLSGIVARSHGMALRETFPYLEEKFGNRIEARSTHPIYLMALLRVADYLQIQKERAPTAKTDVVKFRSPISTREWTVHQCVTDITNLADPQAIDINARPADINTFLRLKGWITDLQNELDISWAVLGEVYGLQSHSGLNKLALKVRRIRSNIDNPDDFARTVSFVPEKISFSVLDSELLKLLVGPLYAYDVSIGLRELIQNSADAVKEIDSLIEQGSIESPGPRTDILGDIEVHFTSNEFNAEPSVRGNLIVEITDRGVGMTTETLKNYFLRAGASFRRSSEWRDNFEKLDGSSRIQRSGRFGVGVLAAFLLGEKIHVETRHHSVPQENGLKFSAGLEDSSISVVRHSCEVGTKIRVEVAGRQRDEVLKLLPHLMHTRVGQSHPLGRYFGRYPELIYMVNGTKLEWESEYLLPVQGERFEGVWNYFNTGDLEVNWTYAPKVIGLSVNQIAISPKQGEDRVSACSAGVYLGSDIFSEPALSIGDNSGSFPLNLQRNYYAASDVPFREDLLREITDEFLVICLSQVAKYGRMRFPRYEGFSRRTFHKKQIDEPYWLWCKDGAILNSQAFINEYDPTLFVNRIGGLPKQDQSDVDRHLDSLRMVLERLPCRWLYSSDRAGYLSRLHKGNTRISPGTYVHRKLMANAMDGTDFQFLNDTSTHHSAFVSSNVVDLIHPKKKETSTSRLIKRAISNFDNDAEPGWLANSDGALTEPQSVRGWRRKNDVFGTSPCVVSIHALSCRSSRPGRDNDSIVFERWMELVGRPYFPLVAKELEKVRNRIRKKLGSNFELFGRRNFSFGDDHI